MQPHLDLLTRLRSTAHSVLDPLIPRGARCALLDFPEYSNVGDSAIWLGQLEYLRVRTAKIIYSCSYRSYNKHALKQILRDGYLLLSGGGNFGDLWRIHQEFREQIISDFPNNPIVQFPQSIHFCDTDNVRSARSIINRHRNIAILVRDLQSSVFSKAHITSEVHLCPDMSIFLDVPRRSAPKKNMIILARTDKERDIRMKTLRPEIATMDWLDERRPRLFRTYAAAHNGLSLSSVAAASRMLNRLGLFAASHIARERLSRGMGLLSQGRVVITDRLHAMILCWLAGIPVLFLDNSYGKLSAFADLWLSGAGQPVRCISMEQAIFRAERFPNCV